VSPDELVDDARGIVNLASGIDPRIYGLLDEMERRLCNGSETIGEYQRLTGTDYPGTLKRYIEIGRIVVGGSSPATWPDPAKFGTALDLGGASKDGEA
jgi:hypothetical protein